MKTGNGFKIFLPTAFGLLILILDSKSAISGATNGLEVCLWTVIPSLFPFIFLSSLLTDSLMTSLPRSSKLVCSLFRIPRGCDRIIITGLLGGYPVGAKCIAEAVSNGQLSQKDGERMLVFCNAAGPAFLFGITGSLFYQRWVPWALWGIHLFSALCIARLLPSQPERFLSNSKSAAFTVAKKLRQAVLIMGEICGWIILMRIVITISQKWFIQYLPFPFQIFVMGILEISNGCVSLGEISNTGLRFILCSVFLGFGGLCVALQTSSAAPNLKQKNYIPGKLLQGLISFITSYALQFLIFEPDQKITLSWLFLLGIMLFAGILVIFMARSKKSCGILDKVSV